MTVKSKTPRNFIISKRLEVQTIGLHLRIQFNTIFMLIKFEAFISIIMEFFIFLPLKLELLRASDKVELHSSTLALAVKRSGKGLTIFVSVTTYLSFSSNPNPLATLGGTT